MNIIPWQHDGPPSLLQSDFDDLWKGFWRNGDRYTSHLPEVFGNRPFPAVNIAETEDSFCVTMDCPGLDEEDFKIQAMGNQLMISGERRWEEEKKDKEYLRVESQYGTFERVIKLPDNARTDPETVVARYKKGTLTVTVPKLEKTPATKITVQPG